MNKKKILLIVVAIVVVAAGIIVAVVSQKEKEMEQDEEVMVLSYHFSLAQNDYNVALRHYEEEHEEVKKAQRRLFEKKQKLDSHPKVQAYLSAFQKVRLMYDQIQMDLFDPFTHPSHCHEKK